MNLPQARPPARGRRERPRVGFGSLPAAMPGWISTNCRKRGGAVLSGPLRSRLHRSSPWRGLLPALRACIPPTKHL